MFRLAWLTLLTSSITSASTITLQGWKVGSMAQSGTGNVVDLSKPGFDTSAMYTLDSSKGTLMAALLQSEIYEEPDLFYSENLQHVDTLQFQVPWFYRNEFTLDPSTGLNRYTLITNGITSKADIWLNGVQVANKSTQAGAYTGLNYDISDHLHLRGEKEVLVVKVYPTNYDRDFALGFVDWNPYPPDNGTGIWRDMQIKRTGPVTLSTLLVDTRYGSMGEIDIELEGMWITDNTEWACQIKCDIHNPHGVLVATQKESFVQHPDEYAQISWRMEIKEPQIWWPRQWGAQPLYSVQCSASTAAGLSDQTPVVRFGIRNVTSKLDTRHNDTTFFVNGKRFQVLGAGYTSDIFLRFDEEKLRAQFQYVLDMGLNTIRLEGKQEHPFLYDLADEMGIMILAGWECCDKWEGWNHNSEGSGDKWTDADYEIARKSMKHEVEMMQAHPSILGFLVGSDFWPDDRATYIYKEVFDDLSWHAPVIASASQRGAPRGLGNGGMKMDGPYDWVPPNYWYDNKTRLGSAAGFGSELGAGVGTPELDSLKKFLSESDLNDLWNPESRDKGLYHMSTNVSSFYTRTIYNDALYARYGIPTSLQDYLLKAQMADYEATRAQFEAYISRWSTSFARPATGIIYWMLNNAWPSLHWNLFDYYLHPGGSYFGVKAALGDLESAIYDYEDHSVYLVDRRLPQTARESSDRTIEIEVIGLDGKSITKTSTKATTKPNSSRKVTSIPSLSNNKEVVLLRLRLLSGDEVLSRNVYWLAPKVDALDWDNSTWYHTPVTSYSDFTSLNKLAKADLEATLRGNASFHLKNKGDVPAVFIRLDMLGGKDIIVVPITWSQNYITLWPGEEMDIEFWTKPRDQVLGLQVTGKNVKPRMLHVFPL
ncbi:hypothetical protein NX059_009804 [Plenodomus lindquistii]|nr:hypothetical protein NX059_009804 [Plenodomus lindquistii]